MKTTWNYDNKLPKNVQIKWKLWKNLYLSHLQNWLKWTDKKDNVKVGEMIIIKEDNASPSKWIISRIIEVFYGKDQRVRV